MEPAEHDGSGYFADRVRAAGVADCELDAARVDCGEMVRRAADELVPSRRTAQLLSRGRYFFGGHRRAWIVFLVQRKSVVPLRLPVGRVDAYLYALFEVQDFCGEEEVHLVQ